MSFVQPVSFSSAPALRFRLSLERQLPSKRPDIFTPHTHNDSSPISALYFSLFPQKTSTKLDLFSTISLSLLTPFSQLPSIPHPAPPATHASFLSTNHWPPAPSNTNQAETFLQPCAKRSKPLLTTLQPKSYLPR